MKNRIFIVMVLVSMLAAAGTQAQNLPGNIWSSPQSSTTEGRFRSNADDYIRPDAYTGVKLDKWLGITSFLWDATYTAIATAGFAANAGNVYIGTFYTGNFWADAPANNYSERRFVTAPAGGAAGKTYNVYNNISVMPNPVNNAAVLIGVADMGFRLTYRTNHQSFNQSNIVTGNQLYKNYQAEEGYIAPQIAWAMAKDLTGNGIRPYLTVDLVFERNAQTEEKAGGDVVDKVDDEGNDYTETYFGAKVIHSLNHFDPVLSVGLGGFTFINKDGFKGALDLDYVLTFNFYDNEYSYISNGQYKTGKINGTYSPGSFPYNERSYLSNLLTPSVAGSWSKDNLALKFKLNLPFTFTYEAANTMSMDSASGSLLYNGNHDTITTFSFRPDLRLALQYKIIPDRLTLNAGARIQATILSLKTTDRTYYTGGIAGLSEKIHNDSFSDVDPASAGGNTVFISRFHIGPSFYLTENAWVEATTGVSNAYGNSETIDMVAPGGLFAFGSILVGVKF